MIVKIFKKEPELINKGENIFVVREDLELIAKIENIDEGE